jgi:hypothetical protein
MAVQMVPILVLLGAVGWLVCAVSFQEESGNEDRLAWRTPSIRLAGTARAAGHTFQRWVTAVLARIAAIRTERRRGANQGRETQARRVAFKDSFLLTLDVPTEDGEGFVLAPASGKDRQRLRGTLGLIVMIALVGAGVALALAGAGWEISRLITGGAT